MATLFDVGRSFLVSGKPFESLRIYAKAIHAASDAKTITMAINSIDTLVTLQMESSSKEWARRLLLIGLATKFPLTSDGQIALKQLSKLASTLHNHIKSPLLIIAGGCSSKVENQMKDYHEFILKAFSGFRGTVISGGTISGISGLVGELQSACPNTMRTIGYFPKTKKFLVDKRYLECCFTESETFSPLEPLQYWIDILTAGVDPSKVKLIGINGGKVSALEYRMALAFGAQVAIVEFSGMEADTMLLDKDWNKSANLFSIPPNSAQTRTFLTQ